MNLPTILYTFEVDDFADFDESEDTLLLKGEPLPGIGARCLLVPSMSGHQMYLIDRIWTIESIEEINEGGWTHALDISSDRVPNPMPWYDITEYLLAEGLAQVVGAPAWNPSSSGFYDGATRVVHKPTIEAILRLLGFT